MHIYTHTLGPNIIHVCIYGLRYSLAKDEAAGLYVLRELNSNSSAVVTNKKSQEAKLCRQENEWYVFFPDGQIAFNCNYWFKNSTQVVMGGILTG